MTKKELVQTAYEQFYEYVEKSVDKNGWVKREEHSGFIRNHFYLGNNIETKFIDKVEYWRPKTLEGIETNNGWLKLKGIYGEIKDYYVEFYNINSGEHYFSTDKNEFISIGRFTHYKPITKPNPPLWTEEK